MDNRVLVKHQNINENEDIEAFENEISDNTIEKLARVRKVILTEYPNGVKFSPMSNRLLEDKIGISLDETILSLLQKHMFHRLDDVWLFPEMVANKEVQQQIVKTLMIWLEEYGFFSILALSKHVAFEINNLSDDIKEFENFLMFLTKRHTYAFQIKARTWNGVRIMRSQDVSLTTSMARLAHIIEAILDESGGTVAETELLMKIPAVDAALLSAIVKDFLPHIFKTEINGLVCFSNIKSIGLPEDFSIQLTKAILQLESLNLDVTETALHTVLCLAYNVNFNHVYQISNNKMFRNIVAQYFKGETPHVWSCGVFLEVRS